MANDLPTLDVSTLASVTGGSAKARAAELTATLDTIKSSLTTLQAEAKPSKSDAMMPMLMMMMMGGGGGSSAAPAPAPAPEPVPAPAPGAAVCQMCGR